ncbi:MAG: relaxase/mobilization nuclease domain-containing protein [Rickettsiales bacterium]|nr:relaxase/mobilization nuclease domain-containing protein [Rickettsiales bacterium]
MIVNFFNHGTGKADSAIRYLLQDNDSNGNPRNPKPEIFYGDPDLTKLLIDENPRKFKYTSGVIAFRDGEKPTNAQLNKIVKAFYEAFAPGLGPDRLNMLIVRHEDKGNTELHLLIPMIDVKTQKQFNIDPPGEKSNQMVKDFSAIWNHKLGYAQVVEDPLRAEFTAFDKKVPAGKASHTIKNRLSIEIPKLIRKEKIKNRNELIEFLEEKGCTVTRKGMDFISVRFPNQKKATRLRGPVFSKNSDYKKLVQQADEVINKTFLNDFQFSKIQVRLDESTEYRKDFIEKRYNKPKRIPKGSNAYSGKRSLTKAISTNTATTVQEISSTNKNQPEINSGKVSNSTEKGISFKDAIKATSGAKGSQNAKSPVSERKTSSGAVQGVAKSLASLQMQIDSAHADLANAQTLEERIKAEAKLNSLILQKNKLLAELEQARIAELNQEQAPASTPRRRPRP